MFQFIMTGLLDLTDLIDDHDPLNRDDIFPFYQTLMTFGSAEYMVPIMGDLTMLIYNKGLFEGEGIQVPR